MNNKIEKQKLSKQISLSKWLEIEQKKAETKKELQRAQIDKKYQRKLRTIEIRYEREKKNEKIKEKNKILKSQNKPLKLVKKKVKSINRVAKADQAMSLYIRKRDNERCCTCNGIGNTNGHWISRKYRQYRYDENNCMAQCWIPCQHKGIGNGEFVKMERALKAKGIDTEKMKENIQTPKKKPTTEELKTIYENYLKKYKELE